MGRIRELGLQLIINACGFNTRVGGHRMHLRGGRGDRRRGRQPSPSTSCRERGRDPRRGDRAEAVSVSAGASSGPRPRRGARACRSGGWKPADTSVRNRSCPAGLSQHTTRAAPPVRDCRRRDGLSGGGRTHPGRSRRRLGRGSWGSRSRPERAGDRAAKVAGDRRMRRSSRMRPPLPPKENLRRWPGADLAYSGGRRSGGHRRSASSAPNRIRLVACSSSSTWTSTSERGATAP